MSKMQAKLEINREADATFAAGLVIPSDAVGDWLLSLAEDHTAHARFLAAGKQVPKRMQR